MTGKIKRRSLRCGGRPKADFGSIFNTFIAPALGVAGSVADSAIAKHQVNKVATTPAANTQIPEPKSNPEPKVDATGNNGTTVLPPDPTKTPAMRLGGRKKCWIGAAIMGATSIAGSLFGAAAQKREMRRQKNIQDWQNTTQEAANMTTALNNSQDYQEDYLRQFRTAARLGKTLGAKGIYITDGGDATKIGSNTYLLRGGSHEDVNETGQTGIGINVGGNEVEAEGGEVAQKKNGALRIFSAQPILGNGMSPAQAILRGYNKDSVFKQQQAFKKRNGLKDDGSKAKQDKLTLQNLKEYLAQENQRGRWNTSGVDKMKEDEELFIPRQYNRFDDFIREARIFIKPRREYDFNKVSKFQNDVIDRIRSRSKYRNKLIDKSRRLLRRNERNSDNFDIDNTIPIINFDEPFRFGGRIKLRNGGLTSKDKGSSKHQYPSVSSKDFAGGDRSYPIPTKADAVDALRLAGLHGRSDVRSKVYSKYPSLRPKALGGMYVPFNKRYTSIYDAPDYDSDYNGGNVLGNGEVTITAKRIKPTFMKPNNDAMNLIKVPKEEVPYMPQKHNRSRTIFSGGDYLGLGIDTLAALSTGLVNYNTAGKYTLPDRAPIIQASKLPTTYNVNPEIEEVKRYRDRLTGQTFNNTSSSVAALNRSGAINLDALSNLSKLWATKENEENKMLTEDAKNQQTVAAQNVQNELARQSEIARIKNEATQAKGDALNVGLSGLSQAWTNFWTAGRTAYEDDQSRRAMIASSKEATPTRLSEMDFDLSPDILASLYRTAKDNRTKRFYLSRLSPKQRQKYGIN